MNYELALSLSVPVIIAVVGWYIVSDLATRRDRDNKRREIRVQHLIEAYRLFADVSNRPYSDATGPALEKAMTEIQLLGSRAVVVIADEWVEAYSKGQKGVTSRLAAALRNELRQELGLERLEQPPKVLRTTETPEQAPPATQTHERGAGGDAGR